MLGLGNSITGGSALEDPFSPSQVSDLSLWLDNGVGVTGAQWDDSSGNNNHITQSTSGEQATVTDGGLDFEGDNNDHYDLTTSIDIGGSNPWTVFVVLKMESYEVSGSLSQNTLLGVASGNDRFLEMQSADQMRYRQSGTAAVLKFSDSGNFPTGTKYLITITKDSSRNLVVRKNGAVLTQAGSSGNPVASGVFEANQFGGRSSGPDRDFDGIIYEFLLYEKLCSSAELTNIENHLISEHGL
tara:strand:- start:807 stop:1532 length:726 start_codon:yes stop_codon:yes gene_type:complete